MKTTPLFAALALSFAASGAAQAEGSAYDYPQPVVSQTTRAAVAADVRQARADGTLQLTEADRQQDTPLVSTRTRAEVLAEARAARASGEMQALNGETNAFDLPFGHRVSTLHLAAR